MGNWMLVVLCSQHASTGAMWDRDRQAVFVKREPSFAIWKQMGIIMWLRTRSETKALSYVPATGTRHNDGMQKPESAGIIVQPLTFPDFTSEAP